MKDWRLVCLPLNPQWRPAWRSKWHQDSKGIHHCVRRRNGPVPLSNLGSSWRKGKHGSAHSSSRRVSNLPHTQSVHISEMLLHPTCTLGSDIHIVCLFLSSIHLGDVTMDGKLPSITSISFLSNPLGTKWTQGAWICHGAMCFCKTSSASRPCPLKHHPRLLEKNRDHQILWRSPQMGTRCFIRAALFSDKNL